MAKSKRRYDDDEPKPKNDAYTGLLALSLIALLASCVVLYLDYAQYGSTAAPKLNIPKSNPGGGGATPNMEVSQAPAMLGDLVAEPLPTPIHNVTSPIVPVAGVETNEDGPTLLPPN